MTRRSVYNLPFRRRREQKTDYRKRRAYVVSGAARMVARPTNKNIFVQIVEATSAGDKVLASAYSKELTRNYGWKGGCGNLPAAYLTGFLAGSRSLSKGVSEAILDIGLRRASRGSRVFAALKGGIDAGLKVPHSEEMLPEEARIRGNHIATYAKLLSSTPEKGKKTFVKYSKHDLKPEDLPDHFNEVKEKIAKKFSK